MRGSFPKPTFIGVLQNYLFAWRAIAHRFLSAFPP
jgi:hypothetical protein